MARVRNSDPQSTNELFGQFVALQFGMAEMAGYTLVLYTIIQAQQRILEAFRAAHEREKERIREDDKKDITATEITKQRIRLAIQKIEALCAEARGRLRHTQNNLDELGFRVSQSLAI